MNIAIDCRMLARTKSGIGYYLENLVEALLSLDAQNRYTLFALPGGEGGLPARPNARAHTLHLPNPLHTRLFRDGGLPARLSRTLSRRYDLVHEPAYEPLPVAPRTVLTIHDLILFRRPEYSPAVTARYQRRLRDSARRAAVILADSEHTRRDILELLDVPPEKVRTALLGVRPADFQALAPDEDAQATLAGLGVTSPFLLSLGDLYRRKNNLTLVRAFARLPPDLRRTHQLVIAGAEKDADVMRELREEIAGAGLEGRVLLPGYVPHPARQALMARAQALCYPTLYEGFGLPPLEAMACGVPTVSSNNSSIPEVVGDAGLLVSDYADPDAWAAALSRLLTDPPLRAALTAQGRARARLFTWERTARETLRAYAQAVAVG